MVPLAVNNNKTMILIRMMTIWFVATMNTRTTYILHAFIPKPLISREHQHSVTVLYEENPVLTPAKRLQLEQGRITKPPSQKIKASTLSVPFDRVKDILYGMGDTFETFKKSTGKTETIYDGYKDVSKRQSPVQRLLQRASQRRTISTAIRNGKENTLDANLSVFDNIKDRLYGTVDLLLRKSSTTIRPSRSSTRRVLPESYNELLNQLESKNTLTRNLAEVKLRYVQIQEGMERTKQVLQTATEDVKERSYNTLEFAQRTVTEIAALPDQARTTVQQVAMVVNSIPDTVNGVIDTITSIPKAVEEKATKAKKSVALTVDNTVQVAKKVKAIPFQVKQSAESTIQSTTQVVNKVKSIPTKIQQTTETTIQMANRTVDLVVKVVNTIQTLPSQVQQTANDVSFNTKVVLGLKQPKPKPPLPFPKTIREFALRAVGVIAQGTGQAAWWIVQNTALFLWNGTMSNLDKVKGKYDTTQQQQQQQLSTKPTRMEPLSTKTSVEQTATFTVPPSLTSGNVSSSVLLQQKEQTPPPTSRSMASAIDSDDLSFTAKILDDPILDDEIAGACTLRLSDCVNMCACAFLLAFVLQKICKRYSPIFH